MPVLSNPRYKGFAVSPSQWYNTLRRSGVPFEHFQEPVDLFRYVWTMPYVVLPWSVVYEGGRC